jgi:hypothetical protein
LNDGFQGVLADLGHGEVGGDSLDHEGVGGEIAGKVKHGGAVDDQAGVWGVSEAGFGDDLQRLPAQDSAMISFHSSMAGGGPGGAGNIPNTSSNVFVRAGSAWISTRPLGSALASV